MNAGTIESRVLTGELALDQVKPDWRDGIDLDNLSMASPCRCILGQVFNGYREGCKQLGIETVAFDSNKDALPSYRDAAVAHGFEAPPNLDQADRDAYFAALEDEWKQVITKATWAETVSDRSEDVTR